MWRNSSPTSAFAGQTVSLSDSILNYDLIEIEYVNDTASSSSSSILFDPTKLPTSTSNGICFPILGSRENTNSNVRARAVYKGSNDSSIYFGSGGMVVGQGGSGQTSNQFSIPTKINGIKL